MGFILQKVYGLIYGEYGVPLLYMTCSFLCINCFTLFEREKRIQTACPLANNPFTFRLSLTREVHDQKKNMFRIFCSQNVPQVLKFVVSYNGLNYDSN